MIKKIVIAALALLGATALLGMIVQHFELLES